MGTVAGKRKKGNTTKTRGEKTTPTKTVAAQPAQPAKPPKPLAPGALLLLSFHHETGDFAGLPKDVIFYIAHFLADQRGAVDTLWEYAQVYSASWSFRYASGGLDKRLYDWWANTLEELSTQKLQPATEEDPDANHASITIPGMYGGATFYLRGELSDTVHLSFTCHSRMCETFGDDPVGTISLDGKVGGEYKEEDLNVRKAGIKAELEAANFPLFPTWTW
jgi:hypothetical protein